MSPYPPGREAPAPRPTSEPAIDPRQWRRIDPVLDAALDLDPTEWPAFLEARCGHDPELLEEVASLLGRRRRVASFLDTPAPEAWIPLPDGELDPLAWQGLRVGPWRVVSELGSGSMGLVLLATRADGRYDGRVALKFLHRAVERDTAARERFDSEIRIQGELDHPGIARLIDAGVTESGRPFLITEFVDGTRIDRYVEEHRLPLDERLGLFLKVADAVEYVHRRLVVHRDLKPSNILVTEDAQVKLVDFGIARITSEARDPRARERRGAGRGWMTPEYAAPEQVLGDPPTTAVDVYQLGALLHELLTGRPPRTPADDPFPSDMAFPGQPVPPTEEDRSRFLDAPVPSASDSVVRRDLRAILLKALARRPDDRYPSVSSLAADVRRVRGSEPLEGSRCTRVHRVRLFVRRHRMETLAATVLTCAVFGGAGTATWQAGEARSERDRARRAQIEAETALQRERSVTDALLELLGAAHPLSPAFGGSGTARSLVTAGTRQVSELEDQPALQAILLDALARLRMSFGELDSAETLASRSLRVRRAQAGDRNPRISGTLNILAEILKRRSRYREAETMHRQALALQLAQRPAAALEAAHTLSALASTLLPDRFEESEALVRRALDIRRDALGPGHPMVGETLMHLGRIRRSRGNRDGADSAYTEALAIRRAALGPRHAKVAESLVFLADLRNEFDRDDTAAESLYREALEIQRASLGPDHPALIHALSSLADLLGHRGDGEAAEAYHRESLEVRERAYGPRHPQVGHGMGYLAEELRRQGRYEEAEALARTALEIVEEAQGTEHWDVAGGLTKLASIRTQQGHYVEAAELVERALRIRTEIAGPDSAARALLLAELGRIRANQGRLGEAETLFAGAERILDRVRDGRHPDVRRVREELSKLRVARASGHTRVDLSGRLDHR